MKKVILIISAVVVLGAGISTAYYLTNRPVSEPEVQSIEVSTEERAVPASENEQIVSTAPTTLQSEPNTAAETQSGNKEMPQVEGLTHEDQVSIIKGILAAQTALTSENAEQLRAFLVGISDSDAAREEIRTASDKELVEEYDLLRAVFLENPITRAALESINSPTAVSVDLHTSDWKINTDRSVWVTVYGERLDLQFKLKKDGTSWVVIGFHAGN